MTANPQHTEDLIARLARHSGPVHPLPPISRRVAQWLAAALVFAGAMVWAISPRPDLAERLTDIRFLAEQAGALATAIAAAIAAVAMTIPGLPRWLRWLPVLPGAGWIAVLAAGFWQDLGTRGASGVALAPDLECFFLIALIGSLPAVLMVMMLREGAPLAPRLTVGTATLAAAAIGNFALRFFHTQDAAVMVLAWQVGSVVALAALAGCLGARVLRWRKG